MKTKYEFFSYSKCHPFCTVCAVAVTLLFGVPAGFAQTGNYTYLGSEENITLNPGTYDITAYGAQGGSANNSGTGGSGAEMKGEFHFTIATTLTLLVGGGGGGSTFGGGGGGGSFVFNGPTPLVIAGGGGGGGQSGHVLGYQEPGGNGGNGSTGANGSGGGSGGGGGNLSNSGGGGGGGGGYNGSGSNGSSSPGFFPSYGGGGGSYLSGGGGGSGYGGGGYGGGGGGGSGGGGGGGYSGGNGGGGVYNNFPCDGGGGGGSYIAPSATAILTEVSGVSSPDDSPNGEIIIAAAPAPISLAIILSGNEVVLTWPTNATGFTLQFTTNLAPPVVWSAVSPSPVVVSGNSTVTNSIVGGQMFYRLAQ